MTSTTLQKGANIGLNKLVPGITTINVALGWTPRDTSGMEVDGSAFLLAADGKVRGDQDLVFYNNPRSDDGSVHVVAESSRLDAQDTQLFELNLNAIPESIQKIAFTVTIHEGQERQQNFGMLNSAWARVVNAADQAELTRFELPLAGTPETAMIFCEVYRHSGEWKFRAVGQGYVGGLEPLAISYGIDVADDSAETNDVTPPPSASPAPPPVEPTKPPSPPTPAAAPTPPPPTEPTPSAAAEPAPSPAQSEHGVRLEKRLVNLEKKDPQLVSLVKKVGVQLEKFGLEQHQAKVALCLDISGSMNNLYRKGSVNTLVTRVLALGLRFDDDGEIDVFLFGKGAYHAGTVNSDNYQTFVEGMLRRHPLEAGTAYGKVIELVRSYYRDQPGFGQVPIYVMFATDGDTSDRPQTEQQIVEASQEGLFWQFMAIGSPPGEKKGFFSKLLSTDFSFLEYLDTMRNRFIDNASFFLVRDPAEPSDEELVKLMMAEYPTWLRGARSKGLLR